MPRAAHKKKPPTKPSPLEYKIVELSNVDESLIEQAVNQYVSQGWAFDGIQFAMRESSKRPAMGFVFFTREGRRNVSSAPFDRAQSERGSAHREREIAESQSRSAKGKATSAGREASAWARLAQLADVAGDEP